MSKSRNINDFGYTFRNTWYSIIICIILLPNDQYNLDYPYENTPNNTYTVIVKESRTIDKPSEMDMFMKRKTVG